MKSKGISAAPTQSNKQIQARATTNTVGIGVNEQLLAESSFETAKTTQLPVAQSALPLMHQLITAAQQLAKNESNESKHQIQAKEIIEFASLVEGKSKEEQEFFYMGALPRYCPSWQERH